MPKKIFTLPLAASQTYTINEASSAIGITIINNASSAGNITVTGTAKCIVNNVAVDSAPIAFAPGEFSNISIDTPGLEVTIAVAASTTGKMIVVIG